METNSTNNKEIIDQLLNTDSLVEAEKRTGKSYKEDEITVHLGMLMQMDKSNTLSKLLSENGDSTFSMSEKDYLKVVQNAGFEIVLIEDFKNRKGDDERFYILWHSEYSILLKFDTFTWGDDGSWAKAGKEVPSPDRNGGDFYYNWSPNTYESRIGCTSSGGFYWNKNLGNYTGLFEPDMKTPYIIPNYPEDIKWDYNNMAWSEHQKLSEPINKKQSELFNKALEEGKRMVWVGNHDCREAIVHNISKMLSNGKFLTNWVEAPYMQLNHYMDWENGVATEENERRMNLLPMSIKEKIGYKF